MGFPIETFGNDIKGSRDFPVKKFYRIAPVFFLFSLCAICLSACSSTRNENLDRTSREQAATIKSLRQELNRLNKEIGELSKSGNQLGRAKYEMEKQLSGEVADGSLSIDMQEKGLVVTVLDRVLFDSGRAELKNESLETLDKLAEVLADSVKDHAVYIEGHTDNLPIRYSSWKSNWELSATRALEVLHYFVDEKQMDPRRFAATGYGEFHPVVPNATPADRMKNRRVEIVLNTCA